MARPIAISKQIESPFEVSELIRIARERLILIAQNHALMTDPNGARDTIEQLLFDGLAKGLVVDIIAMHPKVSVGSSSSSSDACQVWTTYMGAPHFMAHVKRCWDTFNLWNNRFKNDRTKWPGKLRIRAAYFLPVSINIVDPERQYGLLVISPRMAQEANSTRLSSSQLSNMNQPYLTSIGRQSEIAPITQAGLKLTSYHRRSPDLAWHAPDYR
jgi:hypothetical protein